MASIEELCLAAAGDEAERCQGGGLSARGRRDGGSEEGLQTSLVLRVQGPEAAS